jgi:hypothetical protein
MIYEENTVKVIEFMADGPGEPTFRLQCMTLAL